MSGFDELYEMVKFSDDEIGKCKKCEGCGLAGQMLFLYPEEYEYLESKGATWMKNKRMVNGEMFVDCDGAGCCGNLSPINCKLSPFQIIVRDGKIAELYSRDVCLLESLSINSVKEILELVLKIYVEKVIEPEWARE
jgi:hypothetical protein